MRPVTIWPRVPSNYLIINVNTTLNSVSSPLSPVTPPRCRDPIINCLIMIPWLLFGLNWVNYQQPLNFPTRMEKRENKVWIVQMFFFVSDMIIDQNVMLYFCRYLIDFTSKLCAKNFALIIKESPLNHGCSNAKILRFIFINPNREWNEKTCQCSREAENRSMVCVQMCVTRKCVLFFVRANWDCRYWHNQATSPHTRRAVNIAKGVSSHCESFRSVFSTALNSDMGWEKNCKQFKPQEICTAFIVCKYLQKFAK